MTSDNTGNPLIGLRLPPELGVPLLRDAKRGRETVQAVILRIVAEHYQVQSEPPRRGKRAKKAEGD